MPRYDIYGDRDDKPLIDGDAAFVKFASRRQSTVLEPGTVELSENFRFDRTTARVRQGLASVSTDISLTNPPVITDVSVILDSGGPKIYDAYDDVARCSCTFASNNLNNDEYIIVAATTSAWAIRDGVASVEIGYPASETVALTDDASMHNWNGKVYLFRGANTADDLGVSSITRSSTTATVTTTTAHGRATGDWVFIQGAVEVAYNGIFQITNTGTYTFTYTVGFTPSTPATGTIIARPCKVPLVWSGDLSADFVAVSNGAIAGSGTTIKMPPCPWGVDFKNRLVVPYDRDELLLSDVYDGDVYDTVYSQLRIRGGTNDWLVGVHPYQGNQLLVFYRKSIHLLDLSDSDLSIAAVTEISRDIGCASRRSIKTCGDRILWLSDRGVMQLQIGNLLSLTQNNKPLSDDVDDIIQRINYDAITTVVADYWNNRYYIAIPLDTATKANRILIYNFLNGGWESLDQYPAGFDVENFHQLAYDGSKKLHATTTYGFAYALEINETDVWGNTDVQTSIDIPATLYTRYYTGKSLEPKRFRRFSLECNTTAGDTFTCTAATKNPDDTTVTTSVLATATTDKFLRVRGRGIRGTGVQLRIETTAGRPEIRYVQAEFANSDTRGERTFS